MKKDIYLDNASTTVCYKEVVKEMQKYFLVDYGNAGSEHKMGESADFLYKKQRKKLLKIHS